MQHRVVEFARRIRDVADQVDHAGMANIGRRAGFVAGHCKNMVCELARLGTFDGPVPRVMNTRGKLVGEQLVTNDEQLQGEDAHIVEMLQHFAHVQVGPVGKPGIVDRRPGRSQDARGVFIPGQAVVGDIAIHAAHTDGGDLIIEVDPLLRNQVRAAELGPCGVYLALVL